MINSLAFDVEVFPNLFSITYVDVKDYLNTFRDCEDKALTDVLTVTEIKDRLEKVKSYTFWISDTDDSQLLDMVAFLNKMQAHYITKEDKDGNITQIPFRTDLYGYNTLGYDNLMISFFLMNFNRFDNTRQLCKAIKEFSDKVITLEKDRDEYYKDQQIELVRKYRLPYASVDLFTLFGLNAASVREDKDTGQRVKFGKSLKQVSINLKWHELLDFTLPPIDIDEQRAYWDKKDHYRGYTLKQLNEFITNDFDRYVLPKYVEPMLHYNKNDVFIVCEIIRQKPDEIKLRYSISAAFKLNLLSAARSKISKELFTKMYSKATGLHPSDFIKKRTERNRLTFKNIIFDSISFKTKELQEFLSNMKTKVIYHTTKKEFNESVTFYGTTYTIATGGIHSVDMPMYLKSDDVYEYVHFDVSSFYPSLMIKYNIAPAHLVQKAFDNIVDYIKTTRLTAKHAKEGDPMVIAGVHNSITAQALKIVINAIYGLLGDENFYLYDRKAQMQVTINGQLILLMLVEALELEGIHVLSANTDGIVVKLPRKKNDVFLRVTNEWQEKTGLSADTDHYLYYIDRDINNYVDVQCKKGKEVYEFKGGLDPKQYIKDLSKGFDMPIVRTAAFEYLVHNVPVMTTLRSCTDILSFCKTQNVGRNFDVVYDKVVDGQMQTIYSQRHVRFYVSYNGVIIQKEDSITHKRSRLASGNPVTILNSLDDKPITERNINYKYYYEEAYKLISPIKLGISPKQKGNKQKGTLSGKALLKKYGNDFTNLFDNDMNNGYS